MADGMIRIGNMIYFNTFADRPAGQGHDAVKAA
jgi:hypothetical protein